MGGKYQMTTKYTKWPKNISNGRKIDQMVLKYATIFHCKPLQNVPKLGFGIFGLKTNHLASLGAEVGTEVGSNIRNVFRPCVEPQTSQTFLVRSRVARW
jgi:hypothetical protein